MPYDSIWCCERLAVAGIEPSVGSRGDNCDNALAETINGLYKAELIHRRPPFALETMLRIHFMQQWLGLTDPAMEEALQDVPLYCQFARLPGPEPVA